MIRQWVVTGTLVTAMAVFAAPAKAAPISFDISRCASGDCASFIQSGRGSILASLDVVNGNDLLITLTNALRKDAHNDDPVLTNLGFEYAGLLTGLTFDSFTVLSGTVATPSFTVDSSIKAFYIDFGFGFSQDGRAAYRDGMFQAMDPQEVVQILVGTTGDVDLSQFSLGVAKVGGTGNEGRGGGAVLLSTPEPGTLALLTIGLAGAGVTRRRFRLTA